MTASSVLAIAMSQIGVPYVWGGETPGQAFDCSGLVQWVYAQAGIALPRTSQAQAAATTPVSASQVQPGDLVFSAGSDGTASSPGHVGIYVGSGQYIDAPFTGAKVRLDKVPTDATFGRVSNAGSSATDTGVSIGGVNPLDPLGLGGGTVDAVTGLGTLVGDLTSSAFWKRIGIFTLGSAVFTVGLVVFFLSTPEGQKVVSEGTQVAATAALA